MSASLRWDYPLQVPRDRIFQRSISAVTAPPAVLLIKHFSDVLPRFRIADEYFISEYIGFCQGVDALSPVVRICGIACPFIHNPSIYIIAEEITHVNIYLGGVLSRDSSTADAFYSVIQMGFMRLSAIPTVSFHHLHPGFALYA